MPRLWSIAPPKQSQKIGHFVKYLPLENALKREGILTFPLTILVS